MLSISDQKSKLFWLNEVDKKSFNVSIYRFFDVFRYLDDYNTHLLQFFFYFINYFDLSGINIKGFFFKLRNHSVFIRRIAWNENLILKLMEIIRNNIENLFEKSSVLSIFIIMSKIFAYGFKSNRVYEFTMKMISQMLVNSKTHFDSFILNSRSLILKLFLTYYRKDFKTISCIIDRLSSNDFIFYLIKFLKIKY